MKGFLNLAEVGKFLKHALYVRREEILLEGNFGNLCEYVINDTLVIREIEAKDQETLSRFYAESKLSDLYTKERIQRYFSNGCRCHVAKRGERIIGHIWWGGHDMKFRSCDPALRYFKDSFKPGIKAVIGVDFYIVPEERGRGTALEFMHKMWQRLQGLGYEQWLGTVSPDNRGARWTYKLLGYQDVRKIVIHRIFNYFVFIGGELYFSPHSHSS